MVSYETLMEGGTAGAVIKPGDADGSDLYHRVNLDPGTEEFMPKDGKTPLTRNEVAAIGWWIEQGAPASARVGSLDAANLPSAAIQSIIGLQVVSAGPAEVAGSAPDALPVVAPAADDAVARAVANGFIVRKVSQDSNLLDVDYSSPKPLSPEALANLAAIAPNILRLNLRAAGVTDAGVKTIASFSNLRHLRLEQNDISDEGARDLASMAALTSLNLTGTRITDEGFSELAGVASLELLYVWATRVTPAAVKRVNAERKDLKVVAGLRSGDVPPPEKVVPPDA